MRSRRVPWWVLVLGTGWLVHLVLPVGPGRDAVYVAVSVGAAALALQGAWRTPGPSRRAWLLLAAGAAAWVTGDVIWTVIDRVLHQDPFPSVADIAYVASYPLLAAGMVRAFPAPPGRRRTWLLDALMIGSGGVLMLWILVLEPVTAGSESQLVAAALAAYPVGDALLLVVLARSFASLGGRSWAHRLTVAAVLCMMCADVLFQLSSSWAPVAPHGWLADPLWLLGYLLLAGAARHPSRSGVAAAPPDVSLTLGHIAILTVSVAVLPGTLLVEALTHRRLHLVEVLVVGIALIGVFMTRLALLIREMNHQTARLREQATTDPLTGLANSAVLDERLESPDGPPGTHPALLVVALQAYRDMVENLGYGIGDDLLRTVGRVLSEAAEPGTTVARLGRDLFAVALDVTDPDDAEQHARRLQTRLAEPVRVRDVELTPECVVGIAVATSRPARASDLAARADAALSTARGRHDRIALDRTAGCEESRAVLPRAELLRTLARAARTGELVVQYQPVVDVASGRVTGAEALVRWQHPELGLLPPDAFIPAAERTGLIRPVTLHVLDAALARCSGWRRQHPTARVAVNISAYDLQDPRLPDDVRDALARHRLPPDALALEVTETMAMRDGLQAERSLRALTGLGVQLSVDDYGVGYGSLDYLRRLPFAVLKVDRAFVSPALDDPVCAEILRSTVALGHALGMRVVAEGVEDVRTLELLRALRCDEAQGFGLGRPMAGTAADALMAEEGVRLLAGRPTVAPAVAVE